jgi:DNA-binding transcriptional MerR regulator
VEDHEYVATTRRIGNTGVVTLLSSGELRSQEEPGSRGELHSKEVEMAGPAKIMPSREGDDRGFRGPQVCSIVGITYRQLDYWARTGLLTPSLSPARGSGTQRLYSYKDLVQLKVIKRLLDAGVSLRTARRAIDCLRSAGGDLAAANLVIDATSSVLAHSGEELIDLLRGGQGVLNVVALDGVVSEIDAAITALAAPSASSDTEAGRRSASTLRAAGSSGR